VVGAGLQGDVGGAAGGGLAWRNGGGLIGNIRACVRSLSNHPHTTHTTLTGCPQGKDFGVRLASPRVVPLADDLREKKKREGQGVKVESSRKGERESPPIFHLPHLPTRIQDYTPDRRVGCRLAQAQAGEVQGPPHVGPVCQGDGRRGGWRVVGPGRWDISGVPPA